MVLRFWNSDGIINFGGGIAVTEKEKDMNEETLDTQTELNIAVAELNILNQTDTEELEEALQELKKKYGV